MKKNIVSTFLLFVSFFASAYMLPVFASTIIPSSTSVTTNTGKVLKIQYTLVPTNEKIYTIKLDVHFPAKLVRLDSFQFADKWVALSLPGYDLVDNTHGQFIKTGGYPVGASSPILFGTAIFSVIGNGNGAITLGDATVVLNSKDVNTLPPGQKIETALAVATDVKATVKESARTTVPKLNTATNTAVIVSDASIAPRTTITTSTSSTTTSTPPVLFDVGIAPQIRSEGLSPLWILLGAVPLILLYWAVRLTIRRLRQRKIDKMKRNGEW